MDGESTETPYVALTTLIGRSSDSISQQMAKSHEFLIEYDKVRAFSFIGDGVIRLIPVDGASLSIKLTDTQVALLVEDGAKYLREKIIDK